MILKYRSYLIRQIGMYRNPDIGSFQSLTYLQTVSTCRFPEKFLTEIRFALVLEIELVIVRGQRLTMRQSAVLGVRA